MFSLVPQFSFLVFLIGLGSFSLGFHFPSRIPHSAELASKERNNCNNVTLGTEKSQNGSHMINNHLELYSGQFDFYRNTLSSCTLTWSCNFFSSYKLNS